MQKGMAENVSKRISYVKAVAKNLLNAYTVWRLNPALLG
jgi:hypothetical protein